MALPEFAPLDPGTYFIDPDLDHSTPLHVTYDVPSEGWSQWIGAAKFAGEGHVGVAITTVSNLVAHGCRDHSWADPPVGQSVDDLASGLAELAPFRVTSPPQDVTIYGYSGQHLELTVPDMPVTHEGFTDCVDGNLNSWVGALDAAGRGDGSFREGDASWHGYTGPGYREEFWILDVEGTRLMIAAERSPGSPPRDLAELQAILDSIRIEPTPASDPPDEPSVNLGIFEPIAGRIVSYSDGSLWGVDPNAPSPASTPARVDLEGTADADLFPLGWSSDGTELLFLRSDPTDQFFLYILHADGTESEVTRESVARAISAAPLPRPARAAISPDGSRVAYAPDGQGLYVVDAEGGQPVRIARRGASPTFSPDGTQIAYLSPGATWRGPSVVPAHVWIENADGTNAHEILADEPALAWGATSLAWSPAGDRIAMAGSSHHAEIDTFAPDGSDFTMVIPEGAGTPYWSPDGSQIAYRQFFPPGPFGLSIADADGSNVQSLLLGGEAGPWHPGAFAAIEPTPAPSTTSTTVETPTRVETPTPVETPSPVATDDILAEGTVLRFDFDPDRGPGELVAVDPATGESRVLLSGLADLFRAEWSADHRWVAVENGMGLWVMRPGGKPRRVSDQATLWSWSPNGARLETLDVDGQHLRVVDVAAGTTIDLGELRGEVTSVPVWSPDGARLVYGAKGGTISVVDVDSGERSVLVELPGDDLDSVDGIAWSPDGEVIAIFNDTEAAHGRLYLVNADGSHVRVLLDDVDLGGMAWSPDGARLAYIKHTHAATMILTQTRDGDAPTRLAEAPDAECAGFNGCGSPLVWSPDGSRIALRRADEGTYLAVDAAGNARPITAMTYARWNGGRYP
jgi:Tol biopolymer transport system component